MLRKRVVRMASVIYLPAAFALPTGQGLSAGASAKLPARKVPANGLCTMIIIVTAVTAAKGEQWAVQILLCTEPRPREATAAALHPTAA